MKWLNDASKLRINPQIPRKLDESKKPVTDWQPIKPPTTHTKIPG